MFSTNFQKELFYILLASFMSSFAYAQTPISYHQANTFESGGPMPNFVSSEDINSDGHVDLLVSTERKIHFLMGDGTGTLEKQATLRLDNTGSGAAIGDFDGNGSLDIAVSITNSQPREEFWYYYQSVYTTEVYLSDGASSPNFTKVTNIPYYGAGNKIQAEDFNDDGYDDLMVDGHIMLNQGNGSFVESDAIVIPDYYQSRISGTYTTDINNDGNMDIIFAGLYVNYCGNGDGTFTECDEFIVSPDAIVADYNNDGLLDIIEPKVASFKQIAYTTYSGGGCGTVVSYSYSRRGGWKGGRGRYRRTRCFPSYQVTRYRSEPETAQIVIKLQNDSGSFDEIISPVFDGEVVQIDTLDINGDAQTDIVLRLKNQPGISVLSGLPDNGIATIETIVDAPSVLNFEDLNEDGLSDIVYVGLSDPLRADSDALAFVHLQTSSADNTGTSTTPTPGPTTAEPVPTNTDSTSNSNFPAIDPEGETLELAGIISELTPDHFVIEGTTTWYDDSTTFKYESGFNFEVGQPAQVEANPNLDGSGTAIKIQVGPL